MWWKLEWGQCILEIMEARTGMGEGWSNSQGGSGGSKRSCRIACIEANLYKDLKSFMMCLERSDIALLRTFGRRYARTI